MNRRPKRRHFVALLLFFFFVQFLQELQGRIYQASPCKINNSLLLRRNASLSV